jgi:hypothetical protein
MMIAAHAIEVRKETMNASCGLAECSIRRALHFPAEAPDMEQLDLSLGAHLLLWVFPLVLVIFVIVENTLDGPAREPRR